MVTRLTLICKGRTQESVFNIGSHENSGKSVALTIVITGSISTLCPEKEHPKKSSRSQQPGVRLQLCMCCETCTMENWKSIRLLLPQTQTFPFPTCGNRRALLLTSEQVCFENKCYCLQSS